MKRFVCIFILLILASVAFAESEPDSWTCSNCGSTATGKFCSECGAAKEEDSADLHSLESTAYNVKFNISFTKNAIFSTYNVNLYLDDQFVTEMKHGVGYSGEMTLEPGLHQLSFVEVGDTDVYGTLSFDVTEDTIVECNIKATLLQVEVNNARQNPMDKLIEELLEDVVDNIVNKSGVENVKLTLNIKCEKNSIFSKYDVEVYVGKEYVGTIKHGKTLKKSINVEPGKYTVTFHEKGDASVSGSTKVTVSGNTTLTCEIHCKNNKIKVDHVKVK